MLTKRSNPFVAEKNGEKSTFTSFSLKPLYRIMPSKYLISTVVVLACSASLICVNGFSQRPVPLLDRAASREHKQSTFTYPTSSELRVRLDDDDVQVNLIPDVDSVTLSVVGFGLIAFNFFVLANLGDGGIAGVLATIINSANQ